MRPPRRERGATEQGRGGPHRLGHGWEVVGDSRVSSLPPPPSMGPGTVPEIEAAVGGLTGWAEGRWASVRDGCLGWEGRRRSLLEPRRRRWPAWNRAAARRAKMRRAGQCREGWGKVGFDPGRLLGMGRAAPVAAGASLSLPGCTASLSRTDLQNFRDRLRNGVDFWVVSFVKDANVIHELMGVLKSANVDIHFISKAERADSVPNMQSIIAASDGAMVARGDLGAELPFEEVPLLQ